MRQKYGQELRRLRSEAGLILKDTAAAVNPPVTLAHMAEIERGGKGPFDDKRTKALEKYLLSAILKNTGKAAKSQLRLFALYYRVCIAFPELKDPSVEKVAKQIYKEAYGDDS